MRKILLLLLFGPASFMCFAENYTQICFANQTNSTQSIATIGEDPAEWNFDTVADGGNNNSARPANNLKSVQLLPNTNSCFYEVTTDDNFPWFTVSVNGNSFQKVILNAHGAGDSLGGLHWGIVQNWGQIKGVALYGGPSHPSVGWFTGQSVVEGDYITCQLPQAPSNPDTCTQLYIK